MAVQCRVLNPFDHAIDLSTSDGHEIYKDGIKPLDEKFNGTGQGNLLKMKVIDVSKSRFWAAICKLEFNGEYIDVLKQPGKLTLEDFKAHCDEIWDGEIEDDDTYQNQVCHSKMDPRLVPSQEKTTESMGHTMLLIV